MKASKGDHVVAPLADEAEVAAILAELGWRAVDPGDRVAARFARLWLGLHLRRARCCSSRPRSSSLFVPLAGVAGRGRDRRRSIATRWLAGGATRYALDGDRLLVRSGWWRRRLVILPLANIQSVDLTENFISRRFGIASICDRRRRRPRLFGPRHSGAAARNRARAARRIAIALRHESPFNVEQSINGQPWRWRRQGGDELGSTISIDQLLLARGVERADLARHRTPTHARFPARPVGVPRHGQGRRAPRRRGRARARSIAIFGDYDVDGATSAALLILLLRRLGADPIAYIPDRLMEGYGPSGSGAGRIEGRRARSWSSPSIAARRRSTRSTQASGGRARRDRLRPSPMRRRRCPAPMR